MPERYRKASGEKKSKGDINYDDVLIAHYARGNVTDPLGVLHDNARQPILKEGEQIIEKFQNIRCSVGKYLSDKIFGIGVFNNAGKGDLYRTNTRLIYIRRPAPGKQAMGSGILGIPSETFESAIPAKKWLESNRMECLSIPISRITLHKRKGLLRRTLYIVVDLGNVKYEIFFAPIRVMELFSAFQKEKHKRFPVSHIPPFYHTIPFL